MSDTFFGKYRLSIITMSSKFPSMSIQHNSCVCVVLCIISYCCVICCSSIGLIVIDLGHLDN